MPISQMPTAVSEDSSLNEANLDTIKRQERTSPLPSRRKLNNTSARNNSSLLIFLLAFNDFIICVVDIPATLVQIVWEMATLDLVCRFHLTLKALVFIVSVLLLLLIAFDRWFIICFIPSRRIARRTLLILVALCYAVGVAWSIPFGLRHGVMIQFEVSSVDPLILPSSNLGKLSLYDDVASDATSMTNYFTDAASLNTTTWSFNHYKYLPPVVNRTMLQSLLNVGTCTSYERYISDSNYYNYRLSIFVLFSVVFILVCFIYGSILTFVWWHQRRWKVNGTCGNRKLITPEKPAMSQRSNETNSSMFAISDRTVSNPLVSNLKNFVKDQKIQLELTRKRSISFDRTESESFLHQSIPTGTNMEIKQCVNPVIVSVQHTAGPQQPISVEMTLHHNESENDPTMRRNRCDQIHSAKTQKPSKTLRLTRRSHPPRDSVKGRARTKARIATRHLRTAVMFILITASFLISYLPNLLIENGFIWPLEWESTSLTDKRLQAYYQMEMMSSASFNATPFNDTSVANRTLFDLTSRLSAEYVLGTEHKEPTDSFNWTHHLRRLFHYMYFVTTVSNPLIYFFLNLKFRGELNQLFTRIRLSFFR
ncbi:hypothetical protein EG68_02216 [Paragonimus skrjabini miyazakii]|uniref:G-protein coupled receptors family 1 profile domain-containing protein n=1 Tax=Paragonimus skrjabini miyazakii TaxID=59628 RepID=A0A8S9Z5S7_9TREM|nr:hypothetical protein EG68_02216 [Paragonimus skrjabini miyazakii]